MHIFGFFDVDGGQAAKVAPETDDDLWHLVFIIAKGDVVKAKTLRRDTSRPGAPLVRGFLHIRIVSVEFTFDASVRGSASLRLRGRVQKDDGGRGAIHEAVQHGQFHTLEVELGHPLQIIKPQRFHRRDRQRLRNAEKASSRINVIVLCMRVGKAIAWGVSEVRIRKLFQVERCVAPKSRFGTDKATKQGEKLWGDVAKALQDLPVGTSPPAGDHTKTAKGERGRKERMACLAPACKMVIGSLPSAAQAFKKAVSGGSVLDAHRKKLLDGAMVIECSEVSRASFVVPDGEG